jgi:glyoxylase-like metal-dependent hydrolase (beta-lactamase superfamily II)
MIKIHPIQTGVVRVKEAQRKRRVGGLVRTLTDRDWSDWLPIHAWLIEHDEGLFLVDTGETARTKEPGYFPSWHPYFRWGMATRVELDQEVGPQLMELGFDPGDVDTVILTHLHTDHAGGLRYFPRSRILAATEEVRRAQGIMGKLRGYLPQRWPPWFAPQAPEWNRVRKTGPFAPSFPLTSDRAVTVIPTPGHTPYHMSVLVSTRERRYLLAGDTSYTQEALLRKEPDGVSPDPNMARRTLERILALAANRPLVYLPSHDPKAADRLRNLEAIPGSRAAGALMAPATAAR